MLINSLPVVMLNTYQFCTAIIYGGILAVYQSWLDPVQSSWTEMSWWFCQCHRQNTRPTWQLETVRLTKCGLNWIVSYPVDCRTTWTFTLKKSISWWAAGTVFNVCLGLVDPISELSERHSFFDDDASADRHGFQWLVTHRPSTALAIFCASLALPPARVYWPGIVVCSHTGQSNL